MRLGSRKWVHAPFWWRRKNKSMSGILVMLFVLVFFSFLTAFFAYTLRPVLGAVAESQAQHIATMIANETVQEVIAQQGISYDDLVTLRTTDDGRVNAIQSNVVAVNDFKSAIAIGIQEKITATDDTVVSVPLGALFNTNLFAGTGPKIPVHLMPIGAVTVELVNDFTNAGINQTRHSISLDIHVEMGLLMPTIQKNIAIDTQTPVAETIIVGDIPDSYVNVGGVDERTEERILQMAPNGTSVQ